MCSLINESQIWGSWYRPPSLLRLGWCARMWLASRTPLANQSSSLSKILALARETEWDGLSRLMWLETSDRIELGRRCSGNLDLRDLSVSPMYDSLQGLSSVASLPSHLMWYTTPHAYWGGMGSLGQERICLIFWAGQRYDLTPADLKILCFLGHTLDVRNSHALRRKPAGWFCPFAWWFLWFQCLINGPFRISAFSQRGGNMSILLFLIFFFWNNCVSSMTKCSYNCQADKIENLGIDLCVSLCGTL